MNWYPSSDADWHQGKPTVGQVALGAVFFLVLAGLALYWAAGESETDNRIFLWVVAGLLIVLALWRAAMVVRLARDERISRAVRSL